MAVDQEQAWSPSSALNSQAEEPISKFEAAAPAKAGRVASREIVPGVRDESPNPEMKERVQPF
jgi:hypothetical protein